MRRAAATLGIALALVVSSWTGNAQAADRAATCRYESLNGRAGFTALEVRRTIACAVRHYPVEGGFAKALYIAQRESHLQCHAANPYSSAEGIFQVVEGTWFAWHAAISPRWWHTRWNLVHNRGMCRANVMVSVLAAHRWGWGPWE